MASVAIGVPVYNGERYLEEALESIRRQTYTDIEVVIADNASTDESAKIAKHYCDVDGRFSLHQHETNLGAALNYNYVVGNTTAPLFKWAAHDDVLADDFIETCVRALEEAGPEAVLAFPDTMRIDAAGMEMGAYDAVTRTDGVAASERLADLLGPGSPGESWLHMCFPVFGLIRRTALDRSTLIESFPRSDRLLLVQLALIGRFAHVEEPLFLRREHDEGSVIAAEKAGNSRETEVELARWFDPAARDLFPATNVRLAARYSSAATRLPASRPERIRSARVVAGWILRNRRKLAGELKLVGKELVTGLRSKVSGPSHAATN